MSSSIPPPSNTSPRKSGANTTRVPSLSFLLACILFALFFVTPALGNNITSPTLTLDDRSTQAYSVDDVAKHKSSNDCWVIYKNQVFDMTSFLNDHLPGPKYITDHGGTDVTHIFDGVKSHDDSAHSSMSAFLIGSVTSGSSPGQATSSSSQAAGTTTAVATSQTSLQSSSPPPSTDSAKSHAPLIIEPVSPTTTAASSHNSTSISMSSPVGPVSSSEISKHSSFSSLVSVISKSQASDNTQGPKTSAPSSNSPTPVPNMDCPLFTIKVGISWVVIDEWGTTMSVLPTSAPYVKARSVEALPEPYTTAFGASRSSMVSSAASSVASASGTGLVNGKLEGKLTAGASSGPAKTPTTTVSVKSSGSSRRPPMIFLLLVPILALCSSASASAKLGVLETQALPLQPEFCTQDPKYGCLNGTPLGSIYASQSSAKSAHATSASTHREGDCARNPTYGCVPAPVSGPSTSPTTYSTPRPCTHDPDGCIGTTPISYFWTATPIASLPSLPVTLTSASSPITTQASVVNPPITTICSSKFLCVGTSVVGPTPCLSSNPSILCLGNTPVETIGAGGGHSNDSMISTSHHAKSTASSSEYMSSSMFITSTDSISSSSMSTSVKSTSQATQTTQTSFGLSTRNPPRIFHIIHLVLGLWASNVQASAPSTTAIPCTSDARYGCVGKIPITKIAPPHATPSICPGQSTASCLGGIVLYNRGLSDRDPTATFQTLWNTTVTALSMTSAAVTPTHTSKTSGAKKAKVLDGDMLDVLMMLIVGRLAVRRLALADFEPRPRQSFFKHGNGWKMD